MIDDENKDEREQAKPKNVELDNTKYFNNDIVQQGR